MQVALFVGGVAFNVGIFLWMAPGRSRVHRRLRRAMLSVDNLLSSS